MSVHSNGYYDEMFGNSSPNKPPLGTVERYIYDDDAFKARLQKEREQNEIIERDTRVFLEREASIEELNKREQQRHSQWSKNKAAHYDSISREEWLKKFPERLGEPYVPPVPEPDPEPEWKVKLTDEEIAKQRLQSAEKMKRYEDRLAFIRFGWISAAIIAIALIVHFYL